jgi:hypothetical protein
MTALHDLEIRRATAARKLDKLTEPRRALEAAETELGDLERQIDQARAAAEREATIARLLEHAATRIEETAQVLEPASEQ